MCRRAARNICVPLFLAALCVSCATVRDFGDVDDGVYWGDFAGAHEQLNEKKDRLYAKTDTVLYHLDSGMISHYGRFFDRSNEELAEAERQIYNNFTKSVTQAVGSYVVNDSVVDYAGEEYEDIYTNIFMALNYYHLGNMEDAFVEIRRFDNKQKELSTKYAAAILSARQSAPGDIDESVARYGDSVIQFHNSALARYLSMLFYRSEGQYDSADVDRRLLLNAFAAQPQLYPFPVPSCIPSELEIPADKARLNFISFSGLAPRKHEEAIRVHLLSSGVYYKIALPVMTDTPSQVASIRAVFDTGEVLPLEIIENISAIAKDTFKQKQALVYFRSLVRSISKAASSIAFNLASDSAEDNNMGLLFSVLSLSSQVYTEVSETADLRMSRYFPGAAHIGGINLDPGVYSFTVEYLDAGRRLVASERFENVYVGPDRLNLVESVCLK